MHLPPLVGVSVDAVSTESTKEEFNNDIDYLLMTPGLQIPSAIGLALLIILAIAGNAMTITAYITDKKLHTVYNFFIFNLAITDLLLACFSMPFYAVYTLMEFTWPFNMAFCKGWMLVDFTLCFESILLMLIISLDRLLLVTYGPHYQVKINRKVAIVEIAASWVISFLVYGPAIIGWDHWVGYSTIEDNDCDVEFAYDHVFTTVTAFVEFILPFICLTLLNLVIYCKIRKRFKIKPQRIPCIDAQENKPDDPQFGKIPTDGKTTKPESSEKEKDADLPSITNTNNSKNIQASRVQRESRAARFLAALVAVFLICWAPYIITTMAISFCKEICLNTSLYEFFNWVIYMKSAINPFLYAFNSRKYRENFRKYLTCNNRLLQTRSESSRWS